MQNKNRLAKILRQYLPQEQRILIFKEYILKVYLCVRSDYDALLLFVLFKTVLSKVMSQ